MRSTIATQKTISFTLLAAVVCGTITLFSAAPVWAVKLTPEQKAALAARKKDGGAAKGLVVASNPPPPPASVPDGGAPLFCPAPNGSPCTTPAQCLSHYCNNGFCGPRPKLADGEVCGSNSQCRSGYCKDGVCVQRPKPAPRPRPAAPPPPAPPTPACTPDCVTVDWLQRKVRLLEPLLSAGPEGAALRRELDRLRQDLESRPAGTSGVDLSEIYRRLTALEDGLNEFCPPIPGNPAATLKERCEAKRLELSAVFKALRDALADLLDGGRGKDSVVLTLPGQAPVTLYRPKRDGASPSEASHVAPEQRVNLSLQFLFDLGVRRGDVDSLGGALKLHLSGLEGVTGYLDIFLGLGNNDGLALPVEGGAGLQLNLLSHWWNIMVGGECQADVRLGYYPRTKTPVPSWSCGAELGTSIWVHRRVGFTTAFDFGYGEANKRLDVDGHRIVDRGFAFDWRAGVTVLLY